MNSFALLVAGALIQTPPPVPVIIEPVLYYASGSTAPLELNRPNLESILTYAHKPEVTAVIIKAHTDTVGSADANLILAERRGQALANLLIADGVSPSIIRIEARGEEHLARPTVDNVAEPLNRRVWVDYRYRVR